ncbi:MAG: IS607 family element RNA-guided endonuclease TnpB [Actinomycetota bacterium]|nr:IS607 family element RNA-guided endonuclease TnpB [Actinomycetota bacterium]
MLVQMRTVAQAAKVASVTGGAHLLGKPGKDGVRRLSRRVDIGEDFEVHRLAVEEVSVLFKLYSITSDGSEVGVRSGWTVAGVRFEVDWPENPDAVRSNFGGQRFAHNWALGKVKADLAARRENPDHEGVEWSLAALRKEWNRVKDDVAPWSADNSKEAYSSGIADLVDGLGNWKASRDGARKGRKVGFPRFKSRRRDPGRVRFTTGTMRLDDDRRTIVAPRIGALRSKESTGSLQRLLAKKRARILNMTVSERWGRLFVSINYAVRTPTPRPVDKPGVRAGVDLGLRTLATVADTEGDIVEFPNPAPLRSTLTERRKAGRQMSRRIPGSRGHEAAKTKIAKLDRRAVHLRRESWHQLTTSLAATYSEVVIEDLDIAAMKRSMGRRAFRRSVSDAALGMFRPMLAYKMAKAGAAPTVADRWYPSSQLHHGCGCRLVAPTRMAKQLVCVTTGGLVDRDHNAAANLRDWPETATISTASTGPVGSSVPVDTRAAGDGGTDPGSASGDTPRRRSDRKTLPQERASHGETRNKTPRGEAVA